LDEAECNSFCLKINLINMQRTIAKWMLIVLFSITVFITKTQAQSTTDSKMSYKEMGSENPDAQADIQIVGDFVNELTLGNLDKAKALLAYSYKGYGPSPIDSTNTELTISSWEKNYKLQSNRKVNFVEETFRVKSGDLIGDWVSLWGDYSFTQNGKEIKFPFQYTAHVTNGKIDTDRIYYDKSYIEKAIGYSGNPLVF